LRLLRVNLFHKNEPLLQEENKNEKYEKRGQEEESELRILIFLKASPLVRCLGRCHSLKMTDE
jgi:hypothetical protein